MSVANNQQKGVIATSRTREERLRMRNRLLVARYFYWTEVRRRRFDDVLKILSEHEFFIEERRVMITVNAHSTYLAELRHHSTPLRALRRDWPSWNWTT